MKKAETLSAPRKAVLIAAAAGFLLWVVLHAGRLAAGQNDLLRSALTGAFALMILLRRKPSRKPVSLPAWVTPASAVAGVLAVVAGLALPVHQWEWAGILLVLFACLEWALPKSFGRDIPLALLLLYWAHPLPSQVFAPMQLAMQRWSVQGSEWLLQFLNVRVWADGFVLRTGYQVFEVPEWCSGMRTATTVFLLALGLGLLRRLKWTAVLAMAVLAVAQALALNIVRLAVMVGFAPAMGAGAGARYLHDTAGLVVVAAVLLVALEVFAWEARVRRRQRERAAAAGALPPLPMQTPPFWHHVVSHGWIAIPAVLVGVVLFWAVPRVTEGRRIDMLRDVASALRDTSDFENAERCARAVIELTGGDSAARLELARLLLIRSKFQEVLDELRRLPPAAAAGVEARVPEAYALMGLKRRDEALAIVKTLPQEIQGQNPQVAMILAEIALSANQPDQVAEHAVKASKWPYNARRIRAIYPYLRTHRKWEAIVESDQRQPYTDPAQAFSVMEAYMNLNRAPDVASMALRAAQLWPGDPRVLEPLYFMAVKGGTGEWTDRFAEHLIRSVPAMNDIDPLYELFEKCFRLSRPDLAWILYRRIEQIDATHPALDMVVARRGGAWFLFRKRFLGIASESTAETIDTGAYFRLGSTFGLWRPLCDAVPLGRELSGGDTVAVRKARTQKAADEFRRRDAAGSLSVPMAYEYARALEMLGDIDGVKRQLDRIAAVHPEEAWPARVFLSEVYERRNDPELVYETLRGYAQDCSDPKLGALLRLCWAQYSVNAGLGAIHTGGEALRIYPHSSQALAVLAAVTFKFDSAENALVILGRPRVRKQRELDILEAQALYASQRYAEARAFCRTAMIPAPALRPDLEQRFFLPPAEVSLLAHSVTVPSLAEFERNAESLRARVDSARSPFLKAMSRLWLDCFAARCEGPAAATEAWLACGRDRFEKAVAAHQLILLLCSREKYAQALAAAEAATGLLPESALLWRIRIGLSGGDLATVAGARKACPSDSEVWLAELVARTRNTPEFAAGTNRPPATSAADRPSGAATGITAWVAASINQAAASGLFSAAAMVRAGEYLFRTGDRKLAAAAARDAHARARGLLPAYVLAIRCAVVQRDKEWTTRATRTAIESAVRPPPLLYRKLVELKSDDEPIETDVEMVEALRILRRSYPDDMLWPQMLGFVRLQRGGWEIADAYTQSAVALDGGSTNRTPYLVAAEASRLLGDPARAADILRNGLARYPDDLEIENNLAYALAMTPQSLPAALRIVQAVQKKAPADLHVMDTAGVVLFEAGRDEVAESMFLRVLEKADNNSPLWFRGKLYLARIALRRGRIEDTERLLREIGPYNRGIREEDALLTNKLMAELEMRRMAALPGPTNRAQEAFSEGRILLERARGSAAVTNGTGDDGVNP